MASTKNNSGLKVALLAVFIPQLLLADNKNAGILQEDYSKTALPILQQSCFACHGPKSQSIENIQDPGQKKKAAKIITRAQKDFPMNEFFPFPESDDPKDDLKTFSKSLRKGKMPPKFQKVFNFGQSLSPQDKKTLLDWAARTQKALN
jgi:hypothetical protein